jgi:hypothetical protein
VKARCALEVADVFRTLGLRWRQSVSLNLGPLKVVSAIEQCRNAALGDTCCVVNGCAAVDVAYNSRFMGIPV